MSAYARNASSGGGGYASLTSSLLARKGEALPAVDAVAHEGVDIEMRPLRPANSPGAPNQIPEEAIETLYADGAAPAMQPADQSAAYGARQSPVRLIHSTPEIAEDSRRRARPAPDAWTARPHSDSDAPNVVAGAVGILNRKAVVTLRMPARELVRLRLAARDLEMSCQAIILDALECYLDANDVPSASDDRAILREIERLTKRARARKGR